VHADTGSLTFDSACHRDALALAWLMNQGASQAAVNDYSKGGLSNEQSAAMMEAFGSIATVEHNGLRIATAVGVCAGFASSLCALTEHVYTYARSTFMAKF
jgi:tRNA nucleotidyltransferase (CCA-adding enzyme)